MNDNGAMIQEEVAAGMPAGFFSDPSGAGSDDSLLQSSRSNNGADAGSRSKTPVLSLSDLSEDENYEKLKAAAFGKKPLLDLRNPTRRNPARRKKKKKKFAVNPAFALLRSFFACNDMDEAKAAAQKGAEETQNVAAKAVEAAREAAIMVAPVAARAAEVAKEAAHNVTNSETLNQIAKGTNEKMKQVAKSSVDTVNHVANEINLYVNETKSEESYERVYRRRRAKHRARYGSSSDEDYSSSDEDSYESGSHSKRGQGASRRGRSRSNANRHGRSRYNYESASSRRRNSPSRRGRSPSPESSKATERRSNSKRSQQKWEKERLAQIEEQRRLYPPDTDDTTNQENDRKVANMNMKSNSQIRPKSTCASDTPGIAANKQSRSTQPRNVSDGTYELSIPPGDLNVRLESSAEGPVVASVAGSLGSTVASSIKVGDIFLTLDGVDIRRFPATTLMRLLDARKNAPVRIITFQRTVDGIAALMKAKQEKNKTHAMYEQHQHQKHPAQWQRQRQQKQQKQQQQQQQQPEPERAPLSPMSDPPFGMAVF